MSKKYPIIAVIGSSGAGTSTVKEALQHIFKFVGARAADIEGDSFHRYDRAEMKAERKKAKKSGRNLSHFGPEGNLFDKKFEVFRQYGETGTGTRRHYIHNEEEAVLYGGPLGTFTDWEPLPENTDLLFYEGLHGGVVTKEYNMAKEVDLLVGVCPTINLEWVQKVNRDMAERGYKQDEVMDTIHRRMYDYMHYIVPQFSETHINWTPRKTLTFGGVTPELASGGLPCRPFRPVFRFLMSVSGVSERVFLYPGALRALSQTRRFIL